MRSLLVLLIIVAGCTPLGKGTFSFDQACLGGDAWQTKDIDISRFRGQDITLRFNHVACGACTNEARYIDDIEFLDDKGNVLGAVEEESSEEFDFSDDMTQEATNRIRSELAFQPITDITLHPQEDQIVVDYYDPGPYSDDKLRLDGALIMAATIKELPYPSYVEVHYFRERIPYAKVRMAAEEILASLLGSMSPNQFLGSMIFTPLTEASPCPEDRQTLCNGDCVDILTDRSHCGGCDQACDGLCERGVCKKIVCGDYVCSEGENCPQENCCDGQKVNFYSDNNNCGACGKKCNADERCNQQQCTKLVCGDYICSPGENCPQENCCDGQKVNFYSDSNNCGQCGKKCASDERCVSQQCAKLVCGDYICSPGENCPQENCCDGQKVNLYSDSNNCGQCGKKCLSDERCSGQQCIKLVCGDYICSPGENCPQENCCNGQKVNLYSDNSNCGQCGRKCGEDERCYSQQCVKLVCGDYICSPGENCERENCCNGQKVNLYSDSNNCGQCGKKCASDERCTSQQCVKLFCGDYICSPGENCEQESCCDGKKVNLYSDTNNCGQCGKVCDVCVGRECRPATCGDRICSPEENCPQDSCCNGQRTDVRTDPMNCGQCGIRCGLVESCRSGVCSK